METLAEKPIIKPNELQQKCIDSIDGKYLVLAGPGTGKTFTVIHRIKNMLEKGIQADKILCLTYSEAAASEMKNKLSDAFGTLEVNVNIYTYHSFCNEIIGENAEQFALPENYRIINETVKKQFLKECIDELNPVEYRNSKNDPYVYLKTISDKIEQIKKHRMTKEEYFQNIENNPNWKPQLLAYKIELQELLAKDNKDSKDTKRLAKLPDLISTSEKEIRKAEEIWEFYEAYKAKTEREHYIDFDDMIGLVLDKFENSTAFLDKIANKYDYIMVDEYQDTNSSQNEIIFNLIKEIKSQNIFVVGDDDQIIYSFQGANLDTINGFLKQFPETEVICLKENMRSTQNILDVARVIAKQDDRRLEINPEFKKFNIDKNLEAKNETLPHQNRKVRCIKYQDSEQEYIEIVNEIKELINSDECPVDKNGEKNLSEIAIITTGNAELSKFANMLKDKNIPCELKEGKSIFEIKASITLYYYLQMLTNPELYSDKILKLLLLEPFKIHPCDFTKIYERISIDKTFIDSMKEIQDWIEPEKIKQFLKTYDELQEYKSLETVRNIVLEAGNKTGIFNHFFNNKINQLENISGLQKIINEATNFNESHKDISLEAFVDYLVMIQNDRELDIKTDKPPIEYNAVQLTTYHSAKGKEYEYVYMPSLQATKWESSNKSFKPTIPVNASENKTEEEWKLYKLSDRIKTMYVGMTRAKHTLRLSYVSKDSSRSSNPSKWILEASNLMDLEQKENYNLENYAPLVIQAIRKDEYNYSRDFADFVNKRLYKKEFSPTALNNYLSCPRKYFYCNILKLDARAGFADALHYGQAIHDTLDFIIQEALSHGTYPTKETCIKKFKEIISTLPLSSVQQREILVGRGENELSEYYHHLTDIPISNIYGAEYPISINVDDYKFIGRIDKIEKNEDGTFSIVDYKTGSAKTEKDICPNGNHEDYYNQICLYKYCFEQSKNEKVKDVKFVFPINSSTLTLTPTDEEIITVIEKYQKAIKSIRSCNFPPNKSEKSCEYCQYKDFCTMNAL